MSCRRENVEHEQPSRSQWRHAGQNYHVQLSLGAIDSGAVGPRSCSTQKIARPEIFLVTISPTKNTPPTANLYLGDCQYHYEVPDSFAQGFTHSVLLAQRCPQGGKHRRETDPPPPTPDHSVPFSKTLPPQATRRSINLAKTLTNTFSALYGFLPCTIAARAPVFPALRATLS